MKYDKYFLLSLKRVLWIAAVWITAVFLHNAIYALFYIKTNGDEAVFFIIAVIIIPLYFIVSAVYTLARYLLKKQSHS